MLVTLKFGISKIMFKTFKEQRFCNKYNLKTKKNIFEVIERVIEVGEIIKCTRKKKYRAEDERVMHE